ncbi:hypothetical protein [Chlamydia buteonis]|uniref:hypothetical protein n=1 Tax=Chlamydia buteonis TaxID=2494525 RepID=UPI00344C4DB6
MPVVHDTDRNHNIPSLNYEYSLSCKVTQSRIPQWIATLSMALFAGRDTNNSYRTIIYLFSTLIYCGCTFYGS